MTLTEKIQTALIGTDYPGVEDLKEKLMELTGRKMKWYDSWIDDGADGDDTEDEYVMGVGYESTDGKVTVRVYYGDVSEEIGYVDVDDETEE